METRIPYQELNTGKENNEQNILFFQRVSGIYTAFTV